ncbi:Hsp20/alpha crystallin family protein [Halococcus sp. IIIV-5B]|uniref:Hsp20/alpha crystallin family protein n=1 Tax=Halococcus sp. IIIV-5B TaxID=2321230 RepID=UPI000E768CE6|nr:Hsp20/alpha crystallin family protein [Halococcus sp. IIIV-5B]RJT04114.1 Hsp20/alpha crystallin family protein [Halococcus sp. IIIV-5B]
MQPGDRDDRDPFEDIFNEIERMMDGMMNGNVDIHTDTIDGTGAHVDVYEDGESVRVVADLPGIEKDAIDLTCDGRRLTIEAAGDRREVTERVRLPTRVDERSANATYNNGILEVVFERSDTSADIDL